METETEVACPVSPVYINNSDPHHPQSLVEQQPKHVFDFNILQETNVKVNIKEISPACSILWYQFRINSFRSFWFCECILRLIFRIIWQNQTGEIGDPQWSAQSGLHIEGLSLHSDDWLNLTLTHWYYLFWQVLKEKIQAFVDGELDGIKERLPFGFPKC